MRIVIIEDEVRMSNNLAMTLRSIDPNFEIITTLVSVEQALTFFRSNANVDLIFSDIELEDGLIFDIFRDINIRIPIIFCTAYSEYAIDAFHANGIAYVLKPYNLASITVALEKFNLFKDFVNINYTLLAKTIAENNENKDKNLIVHYRNQIIHINYNNIAVVYIELETVQVHTFSNITYSVQNTLENIDKMLGSGCDFYRVNRQFVINRSAIKNITRIRFRKLALNLNVDLNLDIIVSKEKAGNFLKWYSK